MALSTNSLIILSTGIDGGSVGKESGKDENELNLAYAFKLKEMFVGAGIKVVMTRENSNGLYSLLAPNKKKDDMQKRKKIIDNSKCDVVISLHMNSFSSRKARGAEVFYKKDNRSGEVFAETVRKSLESDIPYTKKTCKEGDYFIVNCTDKPAILVECGYLSNVEEERLLITDDYRDRICKAIFNGTILFCGL